MLAGITFEAPPESAHAKKPATPSLDRLRERGHHLDRWQRLRIRAEHFRDAVTEFRQWPVLPVLDADHVPARNPDGQGEVLLGDTRIGLATSLAISVPDLRVLDVSDAHVTDCTTHGVTCQE